MWHRERGQQSNRSTTIKVFVAYYLLPTQATPQSTNVYRTVGLGGARVEVLDF